MTTLTERFWEKVDKRGPDQCWPWRGARLTDSGHGQLWDGERVRPATQISLELSGVRMNGRWALHKCNNPPCVNPAHLYPGTHADNIKDAVEAGAFKGPRPNRSGEKNPLAVLTAEQVREARDLYVPFDKECGCRALARRFGVSQSAMSKVLLRKTWGGVSSQH